MTEAQRAHLRLMESGQLPKRTHEQQAKPGQRGKMLPSAIGERIRQLFRDGIDVDVIADLMRVSEATVYRYGRDS